jgi:hypothetical protein
MTLDEFNREWDAEKAKAEKAIRNAYQLEPKPLTRRVVLKAAIFCGLLFLLGVVLVVGYLYNVRVGQ